MRFAAFLVALHIVGGASLVVLQRKAGQPALANISWAAAAAAAVLGPPKVGRAKDQADALVKAAAEEKGKADQEVMRVLAAQSAAELKVKLAAEAQRKAVEVDKKALDVVAAEEQAKQSAQEHLEAEKAAKSAMAKKQQLHSQARAAAEAKKAAKDRLVAEAARAIHKATEEEAKAQEDAKKAEESVQAESKHIVQEHAKADQASQTAAELANQRRAVQDEATEVLSKGVLKTFDTTVKIEPEVKAVKLEPKPESKSAPAKEEPNVVLEKIEPKSEAKEASRAQPAKAQLVKARPADTSSAVAVAEEQKEFVKGTVHKEVAKAAKTEVTANNTSATVFSNVSAATSNAFQAAVQAMRESKATVRYTKEEFLKKQASAADALEKKIAARKGLAEKHNTKDVARHVSVEERVAEETKLVKVHFDTPLRQVEKSNVTHTEMETNGQAWEHAPGMPRPEGEFHDPETAMKALENNGAPEQGFGGDRVQHDNMASVTTDWRQEFGPKGPPSLKEVCADPKNAKTFWCKTHAAKIRQR